MITNPQINVCFECGDFLEEPRFTEGEILVGGLCHICGNQVEHLLMFEVNEIEYHFEEIEISHAEINKQKDTR